MLQIALVVVERPAFAPGLEHASVLHHFGVENVDVVMWHDILNHHETILVDVSHGPFEVALVEPAALHLIGAWADDCRPVQARGW